MLFAVGIIGCRSPAREQPHADEGVAASSSTAVLPSPPDAGQLDASAAMPCRVELTGAPTLTTSIVRNAADTCGFVGRTEADDDGGPVSIVVRRVDGSLHAAWFIKHRGGRGLGDDYTGVLALVHIDGTALVVDAAGDWTSNTAPATLEPQTLAGHRVWVEPQARTEGGGSARENQLWLQRSGRIIAAGKYPSEECSLDGMSASCLTTTKVVWGAKLLLRCDKTVSGFDGGSTRGKPVERIYELRGDELTEVAPSR